MLIKFNNIIGGFLQSCLLHRLLQPPATTNSKETFPVTIPNSQQPSPKPRPQLTPSPTTASYPEDDRIHHCRMGSLYLWPFVLFLFLNTRTFPIYGFVLFPHIVRVILLIPIVNVQIILTTDFAFEIDIIPV